MFAYSAVTTRKTYKKEKERQELNKTFNIDNVKFWARKGGLTLRISDQIIHKIDFYISGVILIFKKYDVGKYESPIVAGIFLKILLLLSFRLKATPASQTYMFNSPKIRVQFSECVFEIFLFNNLKKFLYLLFCALKVHKIFKRIPEYSEKNSWI